MSHCNFHCTCLFPCLAFYLFFKNIWLHFFSNSRQFTTALQFGHNMPCNVVMGQRFVSSDSVFALRCLAKYQSFALLYYFWHANKIELYPQSDLVALSELDFDHDSCQKPQACI